MMHNGSLGRDASKRREGEWKGRGRVADVGNFLPFDAGTLRDPADFLREQNAAHGLGRLVVHGCGSVSEVVQKVMQTP